MMSPFNFSTAGCRISDGETLVAFWTDPNPQTALVYRELGLHLINVTDHNGLGAMEKIPLNLDGRNFLTLIDSRVSSFETMDPFVLLKTKEGAFIVIRSTSNIKNAQPSLEALWPTSNRYEQFSKLFEQFEEETIFHDLRF